MAASSSPSEGFVQKGAEGRVVDDAPPLNEGLLYFGNKLCPYAHRAWWAIEELGHGDKLDYIHIELGAEKPAWYAAKVNPFGTVPAVYDHGRPVLESLIVVEYFNDKFATPENSLLPADPLDRAAARLLIARWSDKWSKPVYDLLANTDLAKADELEDAARSALESFETEIERFGSKDSEYLVGNRLSLADIAIVPFLERLSHTLAHYRGFELLPDDGKHTRLRRLLAAARARPAFQKTTPDANYILHVYRERAKVQLPGREQRRAGVTA